MNLKVGLNMKLNKNAGAVAGVAGAGALSKGAAAAGAVGRCAAHDMVLYAVTDSMWVGEQSLMEQVECALKGGVTCVQLREKELDEEAFLAEAILMNGLCKKYGVPFIINDNVDIAIKCGADGVHVGQEDMEAGAVREAVGPDMIVGVSVHDLDEAAKAVANGADYLGVGAVFATTTKLDVDVLSNDMLGEICDSVNIPVVAIGGINKANIGQLEGSKVDGVALVSAIFGAKDIEAECRELLELSNKMRGTKTALSIAGSDCSGGAGIQADIKTMTMNGVYAMSAITALTAQNTVGVTGISEVDPEFLRAQVDAIFSDIRPDAVKIGMVASSKLIESIAEALEFYGAKNIVVDPVMVATSGSTLLQSEAIDALKAKLLPISAVITPNIPEAEILSGMEIKNEADMVSAAALISNSHNCSVLLKGGHSINDANDLLFEDGEGTWFRGERIDNSNTHGTGCTLSSAIAANLAKGYSLRDSVGRAKAYISAALGDMMDLGEGSGPMNHAFDLSGEFKY